MAAAPRSPYRPRASENAGAKAKTLVGHEIELEFAKLARKMGRLFYARRNQGLHSVLLNLLTKHEWIREDMLAKQLGLSWRQVRRALRELSEDCLISRVVLKNAKAQAGAFGSKSDSTQNFCCLDYKRMFDSSRLKMSRLRKFLKGESPEDRPKIDGYVCSDEDCRRPYTALEAADLEVDPTTFMFLCEYCDSTLEESRPGKKKGPMEDKERQEEAARKQLALFEEELQDFADLLKRLASYNPPYFGTLQEWAAVQAKIREASLNGESLEEAQEDFVIEFEDADQGDGAGAAALEDSKQEAKELPPWMRLGYQDVKESGNAAAGASGSGAGGGPTPAAGPSGARAQQGTQVSESGRNPKRALELDDDGGHGSKRAKMDDAPAPVADLGKGEGQQGGNEPDNDAEDADDDVEWEDM